MSLQITEPINKKELEIRNEDCRLATEPLLEELVHSSAERSSNLQKTLAQGTYVHSGWKDRQMVNACRHELKHTRGPFSCICQGVFLTGAIGMRT